MVTRLFTNSRSNPGGFGRIAVVLYLLVYMVILCAVAFGGHQIGNFQSETDFYWRHVPNAQDLIRGVFPDYGNKMPFYSFVLAFVNSAVGDWFTAGRLISFLASAAALSFIAGTVLYLTGRRWWAALAAVVLVSSNHLFFQQGYQVGRDMLLTMLCMATLYSCLKAQTRQTLMVAAVLAALASLTRLNGLVLFPVVVFRAGQLAAWRLPRWMHFVWPALLVGGGIFIAWPVVKYCVTGSGALIIGKTVDGMLETIDGTAVSVKSGLFNVVITLIAKWMQRLLFMMHQDVSVVIGFPLALASVLTLIVAAIKLQNRELGSNVAIIGLFVAGSIGMLALYHYEDRYSMPYVYWLPLIATVCASLYLCKSQLRVVRIGLHVVVVALVAFNVVTTFRYVEKGLKSEPRYLLPFAAYLKENAIPGDLVLAYKPHVHVGSSALWRRLPEDEIHMPEDMAHLAREADATYLLFSDVEMNAYPDAGNLLSAKSTYISGLTPVITTEHGVLYRVSRKLTNSVLE